MHREGVTAAGTEFVRLARPVGLVKGEWVAIVGSKFQALAALTVCASVSNHSRDLSNHPVAFVPWDEVGKTGASQHY